MTRFPYETFVLLPSGFRDGYADRLVVVERLATKRDAETVAADWRKRFAKIKAGVRRHKEATS